MLRIKADLVEKVEDKDIEKISIESDEAHPSNFYIINEYGTICYLTKHSKIIAEKVNELVVEVNKMKRSRNKK